MREHFAWEAENISLEQFRQRRGYRREPWACDFRLVDNDEDTTDDELREILERLRSRRAARSQAGPETVSLRGPQAQPGADRASWPRIW